MCGMKKIFSKPTLTTIPTSRRSILFLLLGLGAPPLMAMAETAFVCDVCNKTITEGKYHKAGSRIACDACYKKYPHCPGCDMPVKDSPFVYKEKPVCSACGHRLGQCGNCGDVLIGSYFVAKNDPDVKGFCETCTENRPTCALCGLPHAVLYEYDKQYVCTFCLKTADKCTACQAPILGKYYEVEYQTGRFCRLCFENRPHCDFCARPIASGGKRLADNRLSCASCSATAVRTMEKAVDLTAQMVQFMEAKMRMTVQMPYDFLIVDTPQMALLSGTKVSSPKTDPYGLKAQQELGLFSSYIKAEAPRCAISILSELPQSAFMETVAHEYAHLWQFEQNPDLENNQIREGFAQWAAAKWLLHNRMETAHSRLEARDDLIYGAGYRKIQLYEFRHRKTPGAVLNYIKIYNSKTSDHKISSLRKNLDRKPLASLLRSSSMSGSYAFLRKAVLMEPAKLRTRVIKSANRIHITP